ncbi:MAG: hypothetical protein IPL83_09565 [Bdellovibrionales bacterium]|nr:hypothetical protein [Bdellovibrionales bacterium]
MAEPIESIGPNTKRLCFQRVGIFVDAENIELSGLKHMEGFTNYKKILDSVGDREIIRILYYKPEYKDISADFESFGRAWVVRFAGLRRMLTLFWLLMR